ncbi:MAG: YkgJ family cysteine cluster protein [Fuerstiella sp.]|nr:YkgJ family cysteine cluster protein [Fuerstiella sp.]
MASPSLKLPVIQNWSCHNCGGCCREHLIEITEDEKRRIEKQGWTQKDGIPMGRPVIRKIGPGRYRLAHKDDNSCVFLDDRGLCRIHAKFGEGQKPLACQVYPYAFHPRGDRITTSLRFSCPSVVQNAGTNLEEQRPELEELCSHVIAGRRTETEPPAVHGSELLSWADVNQFLEALDTCIQDNSVNFAVRLLRILEWMNLVEQSKFATIQGTRLTDYLQLLLDASCQAQPDDDLPVLRPSRIARILFRQLAAQLARHDTDQLARGGLRTRLRLLCTALRFSSALGYVPDLAEPTSVVTAFGELPQHPATFEQLEVRHEGRQPAIDGLFERYFRVKIQGVHFCGVAGYGLTIVDGFRSLALMYPVTMWLARWRAARRGNKNIQLVDAEAALATVDHNFNYSPALGTRSAKNRIRQLAKMNQITALCGWYSL